MKKLFTLLLALVATTALRAHDFEVDGIYYYILTDTNEVEVTYRGSYYYSYNNEYSGSVTIPSSVTYNGTTYSVTSIRYRAFYACSGLTSVTIPNSVKSIGNYAFDSCSGLTSIVWNAKNCADFSSSSYAPFYAIRSQITSFTFGDSVQHIPAYLCYEMSKLTSITIPNSVTSIGGWAFGWCSGLTSITIGNSVTSIGEMAFYGCTGLTKPVYNAHCFAYMPTSYEGAYTIPEGIKQIAGGAFYYCTGLTSITIPNSVTNIGDDAFFGCSGLTSITIPNSVTSIGKYTFAYCSSLTSITIPNSVTSIGDQAFYECSDLTSVTIPNSVTSIGEDAFRYCTGLTSVAIGNSVTSIGAGAFYYCTGLTSVTIPNSVTSIGDEAFYNCKRLTSIESLAEIPPTLLGYNVFDYVSTSIPVYVPCGSVSAYRSAKGWNEFSSYIQEPLLEYSIVVGVNNSIMGTSRVDYNTYCKGAQIAATANYGYHFVQWSDGNTDNPRSLVLTQDTTLVAEFAINQYSITTTSSHSERGTTQGDTIVNYLDEITISAIANYGYHFSSWNDGNTNNPRVIQVTEDTTFTAQFDKNIYSIALLCNDEQGMVSGVSSAEYLDEVTISANPNYGYHFIQWSDGNTDNPRTLVLTQDTTFTAEFAINQYSITTTSSHSERGTTQGDTTVNYLEKITISAIANYGYHFSSWNDGNTNNPRVIQVTKDKTYTAQFNKNIYTITTNCNNNQMGSINAPNNAEYLDKVTITATANYGYHFVKWNDGKTDNPRKFVITQDTAFTAEFAQTFYGQCGDSLYWVYDASQIITITGSGDMYDYTKSTQPWYLFQEQITEVTTSNTTTSIGTSAFEGCSKLVKASLGYSMETIGEYAFAECRKLIHTYCYAVDPPYAYANSFANYNGYLYAPCENQRDYILDMVWGDFKFIECIGAESDDTGGDDVTVNPGSNDVTITWPTEDDADTYSIVITKDGEVFCTLTFNSNGQLVSIAFAPGREGNHPAQYAEAAANGYRFTVTGLDESTKYGYNLEVKDSANQTIQSYSGEFTTESATAVDNTHRPSPNCQKILRDGHLLIIRDGKTYNAQGVEL